MISWRLITKIVFYIHQPPTTNYSEDSRLGRRLTLHLKAYLRELKTQFKVHSLLQLTKADNVLN